MTLTPRRQREMVAAAQDAGDTDLYFYLSMRRNGDDQPAAVNGVVPVVAVGSRYAEAPEEAHLLLEVAKLCTPGAVLSTALTTRDLLDELLPGKWREWTAIDCVCPFCGGINCPATDCLPPGYSRIEDVREKAK